MSIALSVLALPLLALAGGAEYALHEKRLLSIPTRICVNGTRGKSSVTRLIAGGLRNAGLCTLAKTTGTAPRLILPDGSESPVRRRGQPAISEQLPVVRMASRLGAQALVVECMAITPENQRIFETRLTRSTIGVITNVRLDHRDEMGDSVDQVAQALSETIPRGGILVLGPTGGEEVIARACAQKGTRLLKARVTEADERMAESLDYTAFADNFAVARTVLEACGITGKAALEGMAASLPDSGVHPVSTFRYKGKVYAAVDAFAANDAMSTSLLWERFAAPLRSESDRIVMVVNHREDRSWRVEEMAEVADLIRPDLLLFTGALSALAARKSPAFLRVKALDKASPEAVLRAAGENLAPGARILLFLAGNVKGSGGTLSSLISRLAAGEVQP